jgi:hypothetical protein
MRKRFEGLNVNLGKEGGTLSTAFKDGSVDVDSFRASVGGQRHFGGLRDDGLDGCGPWGRHDSAKEGRRGRE